MIPFYAGGLERTDAMALFLEWIEIVSDGKAYRQFLKPGDTPEATFPVAGDRAAREYCKIYTAFGNHDCIDLS